MKFAGRIIWHDMLCGFMDDDIAEKYKKSFVSVQVFLQTASLSVFKQIL